MAILAFALFETLATYTVDKPHSMKLYWRLWLSFWGVILLLCVVVVGTWYEINEIRDQSELYTTPRVAMLQLATDAQLWLDNGGDLRDWLKANADSNYGQVFIFDESGRELANQVMDEGMLARVRLGDDPGEARDLRSFRILLGPDDKIYTFLMLPHQLPGEIRLVSIYGVPLLIIVGGILSGIVSYFLARYFAQPLRELQIVGQRVSDGELNVDLSGLIDRKDEIGDVARDFNVMLQRVRNLLSSQETLLRDISHELRSPLARLGVANDLARQSMPGSRHLMRIEKEVNRMEQLINQIITLTRLGSETNIDTSPVNFTELLDKIVHEVQYESQQLDVTLDVDAQPDVEANVQEELITRSIENVLRNAISHSEAGDHIQVQLVRNDKIRLQVADNGPGVPEEMLERIFEPFVQVHEGRAHTGHSGIGLAIAKSGVELHQGRIYARNRDGTHGLEVVIELP